MMYMQVVNMAGSDGTNKGFYWLTLGAFGDLLDANMPGQKIRFSFLEIAGTQFAHCQAKTNGSHKTIKKLIESASKICVNCNYCNKQLQKLIIGREK